MSEKEQEKTEKSFIRERIIPRKRWKQILRFAGITVLLAILFGAVSAVVFFLSRNALENTGETLPQTIVLGTDETEEAETDANGEPVSEEVVMNPEMQSAKEVYDAVKGSFGIVTAIETDVADWFSKPKTSLQNSFAVLLAKGTDQYFFLTNGVDLDATSQAFYVRMGMEEAKATLLGVDEKSGIGILKVPMKSFTKEYEPVTVGSSFNKAILDSVYLIGAPQNNPIAISEGVITYYYNLKDVEDGYEQEFFTNISISQKGSGVLFDNTGAMIGFVGEHTTGDETTAVAYGITPLKTLVEKLCSKKNMATFGVTGRTITEMEAQIYKISNGFYVTDVNPSGPAFSSGIQAGDCIMSIHEDAIQNSRTLQECLEKLEPAQTVAVKILRNGKEMELNVTTGSLFSFGTTE